MKPARVVALLLSLVLLSGTAFADRGDRRYPGYHRHDHHDGPRTNFSLSIGSPWPAPVYGGWQVTQRWPHFPPVWGPPVVTLPPTVVISRPDPVIYVERAPVSAAPSVPTLEPGYWYYCDESRAYYPHVQQCAGDWRKVAPVR